MYYPLKVTKLLLMFSKLLSLYLYIWFEKWLWNINIFHCVFYCVSQKLISFMQLDRLRFLSIQKFHKWFEARCCHPHTSIQNEFHMFLAFGQHHLLSKYWYFLKLNRKIMFSYILQTWRMPKTEENIFSCISWSST